MKRNFDSKFILDDVIYRDFNDHDCGIALVMKPSFKSKGRWSSWYSIVVKDLSDNTFWMINYEVAATEYQEVHESEYIEGTQVVPFEKTIIEYKELENIVQK